MKIYVVVGVCGEYSEYTKWLVCATYSNDKAHDIATKLNELVAHYISVNNKTYSEFEVPYREANPQPDNRVDLIPTSKEFIDLNGISKKNASLEVKAAWKKVYENNLVRVEENKRRTNQCNERLKEWSDAFEVARKEFRSKFLRPEHLNEVYFMGSISVGNQYSYEEIDMID